MNQKQFLETGNYLIDEVKSRASKGSPHFFDEGTLRYFSSRISDLCWTKGDTIYFITSEADNGPTKHAGSVRAFTIRTCDLGGDIQTIGNFQEHETLRDARLGIKELLECCPYCLASGPHLEKCKCGDAN